MSLTRCFVCCLPHNYNKIGTTARMIELTFHPNTKNKKKKFVSFLIIINFGIS